MKKIPLNKNQFAIVDDDDYDYLVSRKWRATDERGYMYAISNGQRMHRLIMKVTNPSHFVDHINHNGLDNRKENLRVCENGGNQMNSRMRSTNTTGYKGVYLNNYGKFYAYCVGKGKRLTGESRCSSYYAALDYNEFAKKLHGEFASLNVIKFEDKVKMFYRGEITEFPTREGDVCKAVEKLNK